MTAAMVLAGLGFMRLTAARAPASGLPPVTAPAAAATLSDRIPGTFHLLLSAPAAEWTISAGPGFEESQRQPAATLTGGLLLDPADPQVILTVRWAAPPAAGEHRFAKLTLELPGRPTVVHFFDAAGDIDELLELPLP
jgi:hypothetical protein